MEDTQTKDEMKRGRGRPKRRRKRKNKGNDDIQITDDDTHALLANINGDPVTYKEVINSADRLEWSYRQRLGLIKQKSSLEAR